MDLGVQLTPDLKVKNPVFTASGTFGYGLEYQDFGDLTKLGAIVVKGLSLDPREGNPMPRIVETPCGLLNSVGLQNIGVHGFIQEKLPSLPWQEVPIVANIYAQTVQEYAELSKILAQRPEIALLEVNISCPNVKAGGLQFGQDPKAAQEVCQAVVENSGPKPVILKFSPNVSNIGEMALAAEKAGAQLISLINTLTGLAVDLKSRRSRLGNFFGGLSGPAIKPVALRMVYEACQAVSIPVIGIGGIACAKDILEFILVGAHAVQVGTANFFRPDFCFSLVDHLALEVQELGLTNWEEFRGSISF